MTFEKYELLSVVQGHLVGQGRMARLRRNCRLGEMTLETGGPRGTEGGLGQFEFALQLLPHLAAIDFLQRLFIFYQKNSEFTYWF